MLQHHLDEVGVYFHTRSLDTGGERGAEIVVQFGGIGSNQDNLITEHSAFHQLVEIVCLKAHLARHGGERVVYHAGKGYVREVVGGAKVVDQRLVVADERDLPVCYLQVAAAFSDVFGPVFLIYSAVGQGGDAQGILILLGKVVEKRVPAHHSIDVCPQVYHAPAEVV